MGNILGRLLPGAESRFKWDSVKNLPSNTDSIARYIMYSVPLENAQKNALLQCINFSLP